MTDTKTEPLYVVCWMEGAGETPFRDRMPMPYQQSVRLAEEWRKQFPSSMYWIEPPPAEKPAPTPTPDPRDALIAQMRKALEAHVRAVNTHFLSGEERIDMHMSAMDLTRAALAKAGREGTDHDT